MRIRRVSVTLFALLLAVAVPITAQTRVWRIGLFHVGIDHEPPSLEPLRRELRALGYEPGRNVVLDWRNLPDDDAARETANAFVREGVDVVVAFESQTTRAAQAATTTIPIVFLHVPDPVADGFVRSMARPGTNLTGFAGIGDIPAKEVELFKEIVPGLRKLLVLLDPQDPVSARWQPEYRRAAGVLKLRLVEREATTQSDLERVFAGLGPGSIDGVLIGSVNLRGRYSAMLIRLATAKRVPIHVNRKEWVEQGGLFSYAPDLAPVGALAARSIDRILKGARPEDLPVEQLSQFKLVVNLRAARALGLTVPRPVLLRADEIVE